MNQISGVRAGRRYIITHPQSLAMVEERFQRILADGRPVAEIDDVG